MGLVRLPALHTKTLLAALRKFAAHPKCLGDLGDDFHITGHWYETKVQWQGTIRHETRFPADASDAKSCMICSSTAANANRAMRMLSGLWSSDLTMLSETNPSIEGG